MASWLPKMIFGGREGSCAPCGIADPSTDTVKVELGDSDRNDEESTCPGLASVVGPIAALRAVEQAVNADGTQHPTATGCSEAWGRLAAGCLSIDWRHHVAEEELRARVEQEVEQELLRRWFGVAWRLRQMRLAEEAVRREEEEAAKSDQEERQEQEAGQRRLDAEREERQRSEAAQVDAAKVKAFLAAKGFDDVNSKRYKKLTLDYPLHSAVKNNDPEAVRCLVEARADPSLKNSRGQEPLNMALRSDTRGSHAAVVSALGGG